MKDSMLLVKKYIPSDHLMKTFEDYDKKFVEQIQYYNQKITFRKKRWSSPKKETQVRSKEKA